MPGPSQDTPHSDRLKLPDGRWLGYPCYGASAGRPVVYLHGLPGSRFECQLTDGPARAAGIRVIAPDRPGYGLSDPRPDDSLLAWTLDLAALADALGIDSFPVIGVSGGAPCALACAHALSARVERVGLVAGLGPVHEDGLLRDMPLTARLVFFLANRWPGLFRLAVGLPLTQLARHGPTLLIRLMAGLNGSPDRDILLNPATQAAFQTSLRAAFAQGSRGGLQDLRVFSRPWAFAPAEITQPVQLWHGTADKVVPLSHSRFLQARLAHATLDVVPGAGHFSLPLGHMEAILAAMVP